MSKEEKDLAIIFCPPLSEYPEPPKDISKCRLVDCPLCQQKMWLSEKKEAIKKLVDILEKKYFYGCYTCLTEMAKEMNLEGLLKDSKMIRIDL